MLRKIIIIISCFICLIYSIEIIPLDTKYFIRYMYNDIDKEWDLTDTSFFTKYSNEDIQSNGRGWSASFCQWSNRSYYDSTGKLFEHCNSSRGRISFLRETFTYNTQGKICKVNYESKNGVGLGTSRIVSNTAIDFCKNGNPISSTKVISKSGYNLSLKDTIVGIYNYDSVTNNLQSILFYNDTVLIQKENYEYLIGDFGEKIIVKKIQNLIDSTGDFEYEGFYTEILKLDVQTEVVTKSMKTNECIKKTITTYNDLNLPLTEIYYSSNEKPSFKHVYYYGDDATNNKTTNIKQDFKQYVNVFNNKISVNLGNDFNHNGCEYSIVSINGRVLLHGYNIDKKKLSVNIDNLAKGNYIFKLLMGNIHIIKPIINY